MKIRIKILLGYVLLAILVIVVGLVGHRATHTIGKNFDEAINRTQPVLQSLLDIRFHAVRLLTDTYHFVDTAKTGHHHSEPGSSACFDKLDASMAQYQKIVATYFPEESDEADEIAEKVQAYRAAVHEVMSGKKAARGNMQALSEMVTEILEATEEAANQEMAEFTEHQQNVDAEIATQERLVLLVTVAGFLAAMLSGSNISRRIAYPVIVLRDAARRFGGGRLDTRVTIKDNTEVGELADAFNSMAETLSFNMVSREYVEDIIDSMAEGIIVVDGEGRLERVNQAFRCLFRCSDDYSFIGHPITDYIPKVGILEKALGSSESRHWVETEMHTADGEMLTVNLSLAGLHSNNTVSGAVVLVQDITERKRSEERLRYLAHYDLLTGLPNRTLFLDRLSQVLSRQPWKKEHTAVLFCDLDRFKFVNDTLGHDVGDILLQKVASRLQASIRHGDTVARWSGDEFVIMLNDVAKWDDLNPLAEKIVAQLSEPIQIGPHELYMTASVGVGVSPEHANEADKLIKCADMAMYTAKAEGKNTYCFYEAGMAERSQERLELEKALRRALQEGGQLQVHYQAQKRVDGPLIGFEALVRWSHPDLGLISPADFLPAAEEAGLMAAIDETVLRSACEQARQWQLESILGLCIAVNISDHLFRRGDLPELVRGFLTEYALPPSAIELELTEAIVMSDVESSLLTMHRIRELGVKLSIDDFGTGYSSLSHLKRCPIQMLKIDRSFVNDVMTDPNDAAITEAIIAMAHKMGILVIAEGVENEAQLNVLKAYGCDALQGYWLSKPLPAHMLPDFLARVGHPVAASDFPEQQLPEIAALPG